jgi:tRNA threonylcarbamoyladenosine biosynthesis protein TsaE
MANNRGASYGRFRFRRISITVVILVMMHRLINATAFMGIHRRHQHQWTSMLLQRRRQGHVVLRAFSGTRQSSSTNINTRLRSTANNDYFLNLRIPTPEDMEDIGGLLSVNSTIGDILLLDGDLGAGKTCFSRGFVRGRTGLPNERVTSPTFLLSNTYPIIDEKGSEGGGATPTTTLIHHMDLYRLSGSEDDLAPLNLEHVFANGISLIEWPSRLRQKPSTRLEITLTISNSTNQQAGIAGDDTKERCMKLVPYGDRWVERLKFLNSEGYFEDLIVDSSINE